MYKGAWNTQVTATEIEDCIRETIEWFRARQAPFFFWWTGPGTKPDDIGSYLTKHGLIDMEEQSQQFAPGIKSTAAGAPGMIADLHQMNESVLEKAPADFQMDDIQNETDLQDFKRVLIEGYDMPPAMADGWVQSTQAFGIGKTPWRMVLGRLNGEPVATNIVLKGAGVMGVYGIAVSPSARGQGIGAAITLKPLLDARAQHGYNHAVLFGTEMGVPIYKRIGFRMTDVRINRYLWRNNASS
jgi:GNAT superfamily N-acetyltransferase